MDLGGHQGKALRAKPFPARETAFPVIPGWSGTLKKKPLPKQGLR
jgi:hypothetical protein